MLRTCSLPDLARLFSGAEAAEPDVAFSQDPNLELEDLEDNDKEEEHSDNEYESHIILPSLRLTLYILFRADV